jgi:3-methyladenine DNA glycosylase AlkD
MKPSPFITHLAKELKKYKSRKYRINAQRFFKEKLEQPWMLKGAIFKQLANDAWQGIKNRPKKEVFELCEELLECDLEAHVGFAFDFAYRRRKDFTKSDFARFERWGKTYFSNWGNVDNLCCRALGHLIYMYPELIPRTRKWTRSKNMWMRRASAVCLIVSLRKGQGLMDAFKVADILMMDEEDLVQKGYGWMLKEATHEFRDPVYKYVLKHRAVMPRTALRYAIEKLPKEMRKEAMKKSL